MEITFQSEWLDLSDTELGEVLIDLWVAAQANADGIAIEEITPEYGNRILEITALLDGSEVVKNAALEKALRFAAKGQFGVAGKIFREHMQSGSIFFAAIDEAKTGRRKNQRNAQKDRTNQLNKLILKIIEKKPKLKTPDILSELKKLEGDGVIDEITDDTIYWIEADGAGGKSTPINGLKDRVSRMRKKVSSR